MGDNIRPKKEGTREIPITAIIVCSILLRIGFFLFGVYQDAYMTVKYTDIDYLVFSDAANYVHQGLSPYNRETYRYTPLLAWLLVPNSFGGLWYGFGKMVFMICDLITGVVIMKLLKLKTTSANKIAILSSIWLLNPMVITISTRGSSESVLTVMIMASLYFLYTNHQILSAGLLGLAIHFKLYPVIYLPSVLLYLTTGGSNKPIINLPLVKLINWSNIRYLLVALMSLFTLNAFMFKTYGFEFLYHSYIYHFTRLDHRHNFSVYNVLLYYKSSMDSTNGVIMASNIERYAFVPQLLLSAIILPLMFAKQDLISCLFIQTFTFVTFNKVMTSQYFIWFLIFLPHYLSLSSFIKSSYKKGLVMLVSWVATQGLWLFYAYKLEFLGESTFDKGLLLSACLFFLSNCWLIGNFIQDLGTRVS